MAKSTNRKKRSGAKKPGSMKKGKKPSAAKKSRKPRAAKKRKPVARAATGPSPGATRRRSPRPPTHQVRNVPADEVDRLIARERATRDVVSATAQAQGDGKFTVTFVYGS